MEFRDFSSPSTLPSPVAGEDYISIPYPDGATEIQGVDILNGSGDRWATLDRVSFAVRRDLVRGIGYPFGYWSILKEPIENGASTPTDGAIAIFPRELTGTYKIWYTKPWVPISSSNTTFLWVTQPDWVKWVVNDCVIQICERDNNKKNTLQTAMALKGEAQMAIKMAAQRLQRSGPVIPRRSDGWSL